MVQSSVLNIYLRIPSPVNLAVYQNCFYAHPYTLLLLPNKMPGGLLLLLGSEHAVSAIFAFYMVNVNFCRHHIPPQCMAAPCWLHPGQSLAGIKARCQSRFTFGVHARSGRVRGRRTILLLRESLPYVIPIAELQAVWDADKSIKCVLPHVRPN